MTITIPDHVTPASLAAALASMGLKLDAKRSPSGAHAALPVAQTKPKHECCGKCWGTCHG